MSKNRHSPPRYVSRRCGRCRYHHAPDGGVTFYCYTGGRWGGFVFTKENLTGLAGAYGTEIRAAYLQAAPTRLVLEQWTPEGKYGGEYYLADGEPYVIFATFARDLARRRRRPKLYPRTPSAIADALEQLCGGGTVATPPRDLDEDAPS